MNAWFQLLVDRADLKREVNDVVLASDTNTCAWTPAVITV